MIWLRLENGTVPRPSREENVMHINDRAQSCDPTYRTGFLTVGFHMGFLPWARE